MLVSVQKRSGSAHGQAGEGKAGKSRPPHNMSENRLGQADTCPYCKRQLADPSAAATHVEACRAGYLSGIAVRHADDFRRSPSGPRRPRNNRNGR